MVRSQSKDVFGEKPSVRAVRITRLESGDHASGAGSAACALPQMHWLSLWLNLVAGWTQPGPRLFSSPKELLPYSLYQIIVPLVK